MGEDIDKKLNDVLNTLSNQANETIIRIKDSTTYGQGYKPLMESKASFVAIKGSRNSKKSVNVIRKTVLKLLGKIVGVKNPDLYCNALLVRRYLTDHSGSTRNEISKAIRALGLMEFFNIPKAEYTITYIPKGTCIFFRGMDDVQSITSITCEIGYITDVIFEEAFQITNYEDVDKILWSIRAIPEPYYPQFTFMFNSWNENHWLNDKFFKPCPQDIDFSLYDYDQWKLARDTNGEQGDITRGYNKWCEYEHPELGKVLVGTCNFMDNEFASERDYEQFDRLRKSNPESFLVIGLGNWGSVDGNVFSHFKIEAFDITEIAKQTRNIYTGRSTLKVMNGLDFGFSTSPTCFVNLFVDEENSTIYVNDCWEETGLTNPEIASKLVRMGYKNAKIRCDNAEPKSITELRHFGLTNVEAGEKLQIRDRIQILKSYNIIIHPRCNFVIQDFRNCIYETDKNTGKPKLPERWSKDPNVDPHTIDAISYAIGKLRLGGLSFA